MPGDLQAAAVSSSSTIWAKASKEWTIPAKPKPGPKSKKDMSASVPNDSEQNGDGKARRSQNRVAQRAFRERKTSQLAELQARIQMYEQGEVERHVALQNIAKRFKEENETLQKENAVLQGKLYELETELESLRGVGKKRGVEADFSPRKRSRMTLPLDSIQNTPSTQSSHNYPSPSSSVFTPSSVFSSHFSSLPILEALHDEPPQQRNPLDSGDVKSTMVFDPDGSFDKFNCGLCDETLPCVCREVSTDGSTSSHSGMKLEAVTSILDNLPVYQPPVPLRRRVANRNRTTIFPVFETSSGSLPTCSGDPLNCEACAADDFGKAFCTAVNESVATPCENCPGIHGTSSVQPTAGSRCCSIPLQYERVPSSLPASSSSVTAANSRDVMTCDDAWRQLKSHPNVEFSDLSLLAEVVARRSKCTGPRVVISPAPGSITPERASTPISLSSSQSIRDHGVENKRIVSLLDANKREPCLPVRLVPEEVLARCGREQRVRTVHVDAVQAALRLLDAKSTFYKT